MVRKVTLQNVGEEPMEDTLDVVFEDQSNPEVVESEGGFAPGALEHIQGEAQPHAVGAEVPQHSESETNGDEEPTAEEQAQTEADLEAAGVNISEAQEEKVRRREYKALIKDVKEYGANKGVGATSMINLAERVTEAAMKHAIYPDDGNAIYDAFAEARDKKGQLDDVGAVPDEANMEKAPNQSTEDSYNSQLSKIKSFIKLGNKHDKSAGDLVRRVRNIHIGLLKGDRETLKKGSTYTIMTSLASANEKRTTAQGVMTDQEIRDYLYVAPKPETAKDGIGKMEDALASCKAARKGGKDRDPIDNVHLDNAISELRQAIGECDPARLAEIDKKEAEAEAERIQKEEEKEERARQAAENKSKGRKKAA